MLSKGWKVAAALGGLLLLAPVAGWLALTHEPGYYRAMVPLALSREQIAGQSRRFVSRSLQLHNDICNEPTWEAVFSDDEVNAWLADDLVTHFADQLPPEVSEPRLLFESGRVILAFRLDKGMFSPVVTVVARPRIPADNTVELTLEKIRAGILPVPADQVLDRLIERGRFYGVDAAWRKVDGYPVVQLRYTPSRSRDDVRLDDVDVRSGQIRLAGRSDRARGAFYRPTLPSRRILQSTFPREIFQNGAAGSSSSRRGILIKRTSPTS
jgi:hypothetical protein